MVLGFLGFSWFLGFLFLVWICCHSQFVAKASAAAVTTNVAFLLVLSFVFSPAPLSFFPNYLFPLPSIFLLDQQIFEFSRIVLFLRLKNKFCYSFYCLFQASNSGLDCKLGVFVLSLHRISQGASCKSSGFSTSSRGLQLPSPSVSHLFLIPFRIDNS